MGSKHHSPQDDEEPIVAIGLLTQGDLNLLGSGFRRAFRVEETSVFDELIAAIDAAEAHRGQSCDH